MIDALALIRAHLVADATLLARVGERLYAGRDVPPSGYTPDDGAAITFLVRGGGPDYDDALLLPSVQFKCYGTSELEANTTYRALVDALHNSRGASVLWAELEVLGGTLREPDTEWVFVLVFFKIMLRQ